MEEIEYINARQRFAPPPRLEPQIDEVVSKIVGKKIYLQDPRLIKLIIKWKGSKPSDSMQPDNFLSDATKVAELKEVLSKDF